MNEHETFICPECKHELPVAYRHEEKPEVCCLDFVSEKNKQEIKEAVEEAYRIFGER